MFVHAFTVAILAALYLAIVGWVLNPGISLFKAIGLVLGTSFSLIVIICTMSYLLTIYLIKKKIDPDDVMIPIATAVADVLSILVFSLLT